jgi:hypothetical protein
MQHIMNGKSVIYTKTDLTQICNKPHIRLEAVKRLVEANLLRHGNNFWIEPNRTKKEPKKDCKRILREGWLKYEVLDTKFILCPPLNFVSRTFPDSDSNASKFCFIQLLQEKVKNHDLQFIIIG